MGHTIFFALKRGETNKRSALRTEAAKRQRPPPAAVASIQHGATTEAADAWNSPRLLKQHEVARYEAAGARFATIIHPRAVVATSARAGAGAVVMAGAVVNPRAVVGAHAVINSGAVIEHDVQVGEHTMIGPGAVIGGGVQVGSDCFLGLGCRVRDHVCIGRGVLLGMGAVLVGDAPDGAVMWGMPAVVREEAHADRA